jgi:hypothetical protein
MAKTNEQFDQIFREKLEGHQEKPSALAWERLESQLPKSNKQGFGVWWAIAASVSALLLVAYLNWPSIEGKVENNLVAQTEEDFNGKEANSESMKNEAKSDKDIQQPEESPTAAEQNSVPQNSQRKPESISKANKQQERSPSVNLIAEAKPSSTKPKIESVELPGSMVAEPNLTLPELKVPELTKTVALAQDQQDDEPTYRVNIYSKGIKKGDPVEKNLITELGKTFGQVEGLLGKVDEGFAEIQDKKDNLFASLTSKRERAEK